MVDRLDLLQLGLQRPPIKLEDPADREAVHLLHERKHSRAESKDAALPLLELGVGRLFPPQRGLDVLGPGVGKDAFKMLELEEVSEDELVDRKSVV